MSQGWTPDHFAVDNSFRAALCSPESPSLHRQSPIVIVLHMGCLPSDCGRQVGQLCNERASAYDTGDGRRIGRRFGDRVAGAQGLAQKNTVLAIWMSLNFLDPISSVGPASYILWQNTINSAQIYFKTRKDTKNFNGRVLLII